MRAFEPILQRLTLDVVLRLRTEGPAPMARVEPGQIEQIVMNLVVNARDALPEDGTIDVLVDTMEVGGGGEAKHFEIRPGRYGRIAVRDTGVGIDPPLRHQVFEPCFSTKDPAKGSGLGLSIVYGIAREAGGTVTFTTAPNQGTTFEVLLPIVKVEEA